MKGRAIRWALWLALAFAAAGLAAPFLSADRFGNAIRNSLEHSLRRKVEIGKVRFSLFRGPGFSISDVVIHEAPEFGIEPMAWVDTLEVRPSVFGLLRGRLEFALLRLDDPWVNLTKAPGEGGRWNFTELLDPAVLPAAPDVLVRNGRINFKMAGEKAVFYFSSADIDLAVAQGRWRFGVRAEAARTDRPAHAMGYFDGRGSFSNGSLDFDLELEQSPVGEMAALFYGSDLGIRGFVVGRLKLQGPLDAIKINGLVRVEDLHRWDQAPLHQTWPMPIEGRLDLTGQHLRLASVSDNKEVPVALRYRVEKYMTKPEWGINVSWSRFPVDVVLPAARHFGLSLPSGTRATGTLDGSIGYSVEGGSQGQIAMSETRVKLPGAPELTIARAEWVLDRDRMHLRPATIASGENTVTIESTHQWGANGADWVVESAAMPAASLPLRTAGVRLPVIDAMTSGTWKGKLTFRPGAGWFGVAQVTDGAVEVPALATPLTVKSATVTFDGEKLTVEKMQGAAGKTEFSGNYLYQPGSDRPHRMTLTAASADAADLLRTLGPLLQREQSLVNRALSFGRPNVPEWVRGIFAEGSIRIAALRAGESRLDGAEASFDWDGPRLTLRPMKSRLYEGAGVIDLAPSPAKVEGTYSTRGAEGVWRVVWNGSKPAIEVVPDGGAARRIELE